MSKAAVKLKATHGAVRWFLLVDACRCELEEGRCGRVSESVECCEVFCS